MGAAWIRPWRSLTVLLALLCCLPAAVARAGASGAPQLLFSDITSGPQTGLSDDRVTDQGAIVTVWGRDLGGSQGDSRVLVGGVAAAHVYYWGNADCSSGPADLYRYHKLQEISFSIPASLPDGPAAITVQVGGASSRPLPFTVRPGRIRFVSPGGSDLLGTGSWRRPWGTLSGSYARLSPGDIVYLRQGRYRGVMIRGRTASAELPFAVIGYPNERAVFTPLSDNPRYTIANDPQVPSSYWHFSKLRTEVRYMGFGYLFKGGRIIANEITNQEGFCAGEGPSGVSGAISSAGNGASADGVVMLGNYIHDYGCDPISMPGHDTSALQHTYYVSNRTGSPRAAYEIGWSLTSNSRAPSGLHLYDQGICGDWTGELSIHDNVVVNQRGPGINWDSNCNADRPLHATVRILRNLLINTGLGPPARDPATGAAAHTGSAIRIKGSSSSDRSVIYLEKNTIQGWSDASSGASGSPPAAISFPGNAGASVIARDNRIAPANRGPLFDMNGKRPRNGPWNTLR